ncbi:MAG: ATP-binding cassette domain-containing protein, partial [Candidatus Neoclostridium sp.]
MSIIEVKSVGFRYGGEKNKYALDDVSLSIEEGEFVAVVGHNGSGKSTLAKLLNGLLEPTKGDVIVNGINTRDDGKIFDVRKTVGVVFQNPDNQMVATIIEDDVAFGPENLGLKREEIAERVEYALESVGMTEFRKREPFKLSGGQKQRIAIA